MNIIYIKHKDINKNRWDEVITLSPNGRIYAYSWFLDAFTGNRWDALIIGDYEYIMPIPWIRKFGICSVLTPIGIQQLGIYSTKEISTDLFELFIKKIPYKYRYINLNVNCDEQNFSDEIILTRKINYYLDINKPYIEVRRGYRKNTIRNLKTEEYFIFEYSTDIDAVLKSTVKYIFPTTNHEKYEIYRKAHYIALERGNVLCCLLKDEKGNELASALFLIDRKRVYYMMSVQTPEGKKKNAIYFLIDQFIQQNCRKIEILDFEGSNIPSIAEFFSRWGSSVEYYTNVELFRFPINLFKRFILYKKRHL